MSAGARTRSILQQTASRHRLQRALDGLWRGLLLGAIAWLLALSASRWLPLSPVVADRAWLTAILAGAIGFAFGGRRRVTLPEAALLLERRLPLAQRLSTALELASRRSHDCDWTRLVADDADRAALAIDPRRDLPLVLPVTARWIPVALLLVIGLGFVPEFRSPAHREAQRRADRLQAAGQNLSTWIRREFQSHPPPTESAREALDELTKVADQWGALRAHRDDAVRDLAQAVRRLEDEARHLASSPSSGRLREAARTSSNTVPPSSNAPPGAPATHPATDLPTLSAEALRTLAPSLDAARDALDAWRSNASPSARHNLERALDSLARAASALGLDSAPFENAGTALGEPGLGPQGDPAAPTSATAIESIQAGFDRLEDLQRLAGTIATLEQAQRALLNDRPWRPSSPCPGPSCPGCGTCDSSATSPSLAGASPSDRAASGGAGTESAGTSPGGTQPGSGSVPIEPGSGSESAGPTWMGQTDPTRIPGALGPDAAPLFIPLRDASRPVPGALPYRQAAEAAQSDARHALNQDRVPRAYRNAVRAYFDELP